jgi:hypothetical protein
LICTLLLDPRNPVLQQQRPASAAAAQGNKKGSFNQTGRKVVDIGHSAEAAARKPAPSTRTVSHVYAFAYAHFRSPSLTSYPKKVRRDHIYLSSPLTVSFPSPLFLSSPPQIFPSPAQSHGPPSTIHHPQHRAANRPAREARFKHPWLNRQQSTSLLHGD